MKVFARVSLMFAVAAPRWPQTAGALDGDEGKPGPIMLQGDHGPIAFRKLILTPTKK